MLTLIRSNAAVFLVILLQISSVFAQERPLERSRSYNLSIHPKIGITGNFHSAAFSSFQGMADCGEVKSSFSPGFSAGIAFEKHFSEKSAFSFGISYITRGTVFSNENTYPKRYPDGSLSELTTKTELDVSLNFIELQPDFRFIIGDDFLRGPIRAVCGVRMLMPAVKSFAQTEQIVSPVSAVFINSQTQKREIAEGDIKTISGFWIGISAGLENQTMVSENHFFTQQLLIDYNFGDVTSDADWQLFGVRFEIGWAWNIPKSIEEPKPAPPPALPELEPVLISEEAPELPKPHISIDVEKPDSKDFIIKTGSELLATTPLVNAVFFDRNSAEISSFYSKEKIEKDMLSGNPVEAHKYVLPRIAKIVSRANDAVITLTGATSGSDYETGGKDLALKRAMAVKEALLSLGVQESKIKVKADIFPENRSNQDFAEGVEENQRVDINLKNAFLQEYVAIQKFAEIQGKAFVNIEMNNVPEDDFAVLKSNFQEKPEKIYKSGRYVIPVFKRLEQNDNIVEIKASIEYLDMEERDETFQNLREVPKNQVQLQLENFEAVLLFDYNSSILSEDNKNLLRQLAEKLPDGSIVEIYGSADALGTEEANVKLSRSRAEVTRQFLESVTNKKFSLNTSTDIQKFPEDTPQGRFLNRSIRIRLK